MSRKPHDIKTSQVTNLGVAYLPGGNANHEALELHCLASSFIYDAGLLSDGASPGKYILAIHGLELALKSFLHDKGMPLPDLRKHYGHDLKKLLAKARELGLVVHDPEADGIIDRLQKYIKDAKIRYEIKYQMPLIVDVIDISKAILQAATPTLPAVTKP